MSEKLPIAKEPPNDSSPQRDQGDNNQSCLNVYGMDIHDRDIFTLEPQTMVNDTIVNVLFE